MNIYIYIYIYYGGRGCGYENLRIQIIDKVETGNVEALAEAEIYWQNQLRCYIQNGGNAHCRRKEKEKS
jgi:hypothetical protein